MDNLDKRASIAKASQIRMKALSFGDLVTNVCTDKTNPHHHCWFVQYKYFRPLYGNFAQCTDRKGNFWETMPDVVYPGHLDDKTCKELYAPAWEAEYGEEGG